MMQGVQTELGSSSLDGRGREVVTHSCVSEVTGGKRVGFEGDRESVNSAMFSKEVC